MSKSGSVRSSSCAISRREGRVSEQNADTAARNSLSAFPDSARIAICLKSEDDTEDTPDTRHNLDHAQPGLCRFSDCHGSGSPDLRTKIKLATIR
ncbi:hypothetical protein MESS2_150027 [Mesorhizobium metallidurans STM 2683]|uniref:Uncharacterized protein n=1 Tax=Mesorhizobium metallidurans STM 2683 TaxID=1297569 RepID=M5F011_9HYPH|nr:hypothetical protein MESS2_150027 [Mesorhizobium metallidurans STM 2683]